MTPGSRVVGRRGFTMVEIAIALLILSLGLLPMMGVFISNSEETRANKNRAFAAMLASSTLERYRRMSPAMLAASNLDWADENEVKQQCLKMTSIKEKPAVLGKDPFISPWVKDPGDGYLKEFYALVGGKFSRYCTFNYDKASGTGELVVTVIWQEKPAGGQRTVSYALGALVSEQFFPLGRKVP
ncbi:MAG: prepilin-type N-terminal cleavage/methylation domain-containing protein [Candidatus Riflebacteria bacterium]|nr:prepilin-type N-terminal cleavage/methylation domain-containing protein [Candidatus Riflebacteria bacterium]